MDNDNEFNIMTRSQIKKLKKPLEDPIPLEPRKKRKIDKEEDEDVSEPMMKMDDVKDLLHIVLSNSLNK